MRVQFTTETFGASAHNVGYEATVELPDNLTDEQIDAELTSWVLKVTDARWRKKDDEG